MEPVHIKELYENLEPFNGNPEKVPAIPRTTKEVYDGIVVPNLIRCGAIPKKDLVIGTTYIGECRNADKAVWKGEYFTYRRLKFGMEFDENINHFEDDNGCDLFVPVGIEKVSK